MGLFSKTRTKRVVPAERKFANNMLIRESLRRLAGEEDEGAMLNRQMQRGRMLEDTAIQRRGLLRGLGESGIDSPGKALAAARTGEEGIGSLIAAENEARVQNRQGAVPILSTLLRENQPYQKTKTKTGALAKAKPILQGVGAAAGAYFGGPAGAKMGMEAGGALGDAGNSGPTSAETAGAPGPQTGNQIEGTGEGATLNQATGGKLGESPGSPLTSTLKKKKSLLGNQTGLAKLAALYGG